MARLRILHVEDDDADAELVHRTLSRAGHESSVTRVQSAAEMDAALDSGQFDIVLSDWNLPGFDAPSALSLLQGRNVDVPFIIVSGTVGEEAAIEAMKLGAHDYVMKSNLKRLPTAIEREYREAFIRAERRTDETALK